MPRSILAALLLVILAAACTSEPDTLPTLAQIPTNAAQLFTLTPTAAPTSAAPDPEEAQVTIERTIPATFTATATVTVTASQTITDTPSPTASDIPTLAPGARPLSGLLGSAIQTTILPDDFFPPDLTPLGPPPTQVPVTISGVEVISTTIGGSSGGSNPVVVTPITPIVAATNPASNCQYLPPGGFGTVYANNPDIAAQIGCPLGNPPIATQTNGAIQLFQQGQMRWVSPSDMYALYSTGTYQYYADTFVDGSDPNTTNETIPPNLYSPERGFLKVWANNPDVRSGLGWATAPEEGLPATVQDFANGRMIWLQGRGDILVLIGGVRGSGTWRTVTGGY
jgi:hypothetical protein